MKVLYIFDEDDKYGAPKAGLEMILKLKEKYNIIPIVITSKRNKVNEICNNAKIENYVTYHHKYTYVRTSSIMKNIIKFFPRWIRYKVGNIKAKYILEKNINFDEIDIIHSNTSGLDLGVILSKKYKKPNILHIREYGVGEKNFNVHSYRLKYIDFLNNNVTNFIAISNTVKRFWINKGIDESKIFTIYDGVRTDDIKVKQTYSTANKQLKLIMLGTINRGKGQLELIEAINLLNRRNKKKYISRYRWKWSS